MKQHRCDTMSLLSTRNSPKSTLGRALAHDLGLITNILMYQSLVDLHAFAVRYLHLSEELVVTFAKFSWVLNTLC